MTPPIDPLLSVDEALAQIDEALPAMPDVVVEVEQAHGRTLRQSVHAERDQPPFDRATMDGIALASSDRGSRLVVTGVGPAGAPPPPYQGAGTCIEIMTGAVVPPGADCVVPVEQLERDGDQVTLAAGVTREPWHFVHRRASDHGADATLLEPGLRLNATHIAVLVSAGVHRVKVAALPSIAVIATGDELVDLQTSMLPHQIRRSNDYAAAAMLGQHGFPDVTRQHVLDQPGLLRSALAARLVDRDVLVISGGVSKGRYDFVADVLADLGVRKIFHRVAQRPGKPMWFGVGPDRQLVFALPGNPVSALTCLRRYVIEALHKMGGGGDLSPPGVVLDKMVTFNPPLTWFAPAAMVAANGGERSVVVRKTNTSGDFTALAMTDGFVELAADVDTFERGYAARWFAW